MRELLSWLLMPVSLFWLLLVLSAIFYKIKKQRLFTITAIIAGTWFLLITTPLLPDFAVKSLEMQYPSFPGLRTQTSAAPVVIMVLGGGHTNDIRLPANDKLSLNALGRLVEGIRIHRLLAGSKMVLSGYASRENITQAAVLGATALSLGVDSSAIHLLPLPVNTHMEAQEYKNNFGGENTLILVTDAAHMPRAMYLFHKEGLNPIAAPTNHYCKESKVTYISKWFQAGNNMEKMEYAFHEYVGMVWAWVRG